MPFGWCLCALLIELLFTSLGAYRCRSNTPHFHAVHITYICNWGVKKESLENLLKVLSHNQPMRVLA